MSELSRNSLILAGGGALAGLVIGMLLSNSATDRKITDGIKTAMADVEQAQLDAGAQATAAISEQIAALETVLADSRAEMAGHVESLASRITDETAALSAKVESNATRVSSEIRGTAQGQSAALALLSATMAPTSKTEKGGAATQPTETTQTESTPSEPVADDGLSVGETAVYADGKVRVFVSRHDAADRRARLSINGRDKRVAAGHATVVRHDGGTCLVGVSAIRSTGVSITSDCDLPLQGATFSAGETAVLADGALRVFVSGILNGDARLAINGLGVQTVVVGEAVEVTSGEQNCLVSVSGIRNGTLALNGVCN